MITNHMKAQLADRGYTPDKIAEMTPIEAHQILQGTT
jgi:hypothetical protein